MNPQLVSHIANPYSVLVEEDNTVESVHTISINDSDEDIETTEAEYYHKNLDDYNYLAAEEEEQLQLKEELEGETIN